MLRKVLIVSLSFLYLFLQVGVNLHQHYCGDEETSSWLLLTPESKCGCGDESMSSDCCHEQLTVFQVKDDQVTAQHFSPKPASFSLLFFLAPTLTWLQVSSCVVRTFKRIEWPPPLQALAIFIRIQNFRI
jgi:hypothetical protein